MVPRQRINAIGHLLAVLTASLFVGGCGSSAPNPFGEGPGLDAGSDAEGPGPGGPDATSDQDAVPKCKSDSDCPAGAKCEADAGVCAAPPQGCSANTDCASRADGKKVCDPSGRVCVECLSTADCDRGKACTNHSCAVSVSCMNSLECPAGEVCDRDSRRCVDCNTDADCPMGDRCVSNGCRGGCASDKDCAGVGQLCDTAAGFCVRCLSQAECPKDQYCSQGVCAADVCVSGASHCENNSIITCNAEGSGNMPPVPCQANQTCAAQGSTASCGNWICPPLVTGCQMGFEKVVACSADGLTQTVTDDCGAKGQVCISAACKPVVCQANSTFCMGSDLRRCSAKGDSSTSVTTCALTDYCDDASDSCKTKICTPDQPTCNVAIATTCNSNGSGYVIGGIDCASSGQACVQGICKSLVCAPSTKFCDLNTVRQCSADGLSSTLFQTCSSAQYCDAPTATCKAQICSPNQLACDANVATTCNADGSGFTGARTDCTLSALSCNSGVCTACPGGNGAIGEVRLQELNVGTADYIALKNTSGLCSANLAGLKLEMLDSDTVFFSLDFQLPSRTLAPGGVIYVFENTAPTAADIGVNTNIGFSGSRGGWVVLCQAPCSISSFVNPVDAIAYRGGVVPPPIPSPVTFTSALTTITSANEASTSYIRATYGAVTPSFLSSDWTTGPKTR